MIFKLLSEYRLEFLSLKGDCRDSSQNATLLEISCTGSNNCYATGMLQVNKKECST